VERVTALMVEMEMLCRKEELGVKGENLVTGKPPSEI